MTQPNILVNDEDYRYVGCIRNAEYIHEEHFRDVATNTVRVVIDYTGMPNGGKKA